MRELTEAALAAMPLPDESEIDRELGRLIGADRSKIVVLDDDPTGTQTVHGVTVHTSWEASEIQAGFDEDRKLFYVLTNSRSMSSRETERVHRSIGEAIRQASERSGMPALVMSRSDSTLRGHFPLETDVLCGEMERGGAPIDGIILCPFFKEGGRYTIDGTHYAASGGLLVPASETEFARDRVFGYKSSYLPEYVEEKTGGRVKAADVGLISLDDLRAASVDKIEAALVAASGRKVICVDAADYIDLKVFAVALYRALARGRRFVFRTAAGLVRVLGGISPRPLLERADMRSGRERRGGLVIVGSYTDKTTRQLKELLELPCAVPIEFDAGRAASPIAPEELAEERAKAIGAAEAAMSGGRLAVCYTKRELVTRPDDTEEEILSRGRLISSMLTDVAALTGRPSFIIAKGGITSSDVATRALGIERAEVLGQIVPGVPVWQTGPDSLWPRIPLVIFPGNTGTDKSLREAAEKLI